MSKDKMKNKQFAIRGSGGGGSSRTPKEAPDSLQSMSTYRMVEVLSEGEIVGIEGGAKGVNFDNTPVQNADGTYNFSGVKFEQRTGTADQDYLEGFPSVENVVGVNTEVKFTVPVVRTVTSPNIDAAKVILRVPAGLREQNKKNGDINGYRIGIAIDVRPTGGTYVNVLTRTINGKANTAYEVAYRIPKPTGISSSWDIRVRRTNAESTTSNIADRIDWFATTEIQDIKVNYANAAVVGLAVDAESTGGAVPTRSYLVRGLIMKVPSNYTPAVVDSNGVTTSFASYSGVWDGTFKYAWTNDPAWVVYELLTNERFGVGAEIDQYTIDIYSFIQWSQHNIEPVSDYNGGYVPRYTFNYQIQQRDDAWRMIENIASSSLATITVGPGVIRAIQDRPTAPVATINNSHVVDGEFVYSGVQLQDKMTACDITYYDPYDNYNQRTISEQAPPELISRYGFKKIEISGVGITNEGQARRMAKWAWYTTQATNEIVNFRVSMDGYTSFGHGEVINIADNFYINATLSGQVKVATAAGAGYDIHLDRMLWNVGTTTPITNGNQLKIQTLDGTEITGTMSNVETQVDDALGQIGYVKCRWTPISGSPATDAESLVNVPFIIVSNVVPRQFKVVSITKDSPGVWAISATQYDPNKYAFIEQGIVIPPPEWAVEDRWTTGQPQNLNASVESYINTQGIVRLRLVLNWDRVQNAVNYRVHWRRENGSWVWSEAQNVNEFRIDDALPGIFEYAVYAYNIRGVQSPPANGYFTVETYEGQPSALSPVTGLQLQGGGTQFAGEQFTFVWTAPPYTPNAVLKDYQIQFKSGASVVHTVFTTDTQFTATKLDIINWYGSAARSIEVNVSARDTLERLSVPATATFTNPAPAVPGSISLRAGFTEYWVEHNQLTDTDLSGVYIWHSKTSGFTPSNATLAAADIAYSTSHLVSADPDTDYYVRLAVYDTWNDSDLNISSELHVKTNSNLIGIILDTPINLSATSTVYVTETGVEQARVTLSWDNVPNAINYSLIIENLTDGPVTFPSTGRSDDARTTHVYDAPPGTQYRFRVKAVAATSESPYSSWFSYTAAADTVGPTAPTALTVTPAYSAMALSWTNPGDDDLVSMQIWRRVGSSGDGVLVSTMNTSQNVALTSYYDANLPIGNAYSYRIRGIDRSGNLGTYTEWSPAQVVANVPAFSIGGEQIVAGSVGTSQIANDAITAAKILNGAVGTDELAALSIIAEKIANGAVGSNQIADGGITETKIGDNSISTRTIIANAVVASTIAAGAVVADKIAASAITTDKIAAGAVTADTIAANAITANKIAADSITANHLAANSVTADAIAANSITTNKIQAGAIQAGNIAADAVTATHLAAGSVTAEQVSTNQIITNQANIANAVVNTAAIIDLAVTGAKIANATIGSAKFTNTIQSDNYVAGNSGWMIRRNDGYAEFGNISARGTLKTGTSGQRVEVGNDAGFLLWAGNGAKNASNASFYVDTSGNAVFKGDVSANSLTGAYQSWVNVNWNGTQILYNSSAYLAIPGAQFTLPAPVKAGQYHTPMVNCSVYVQCNSSSNGSARITLQRWTGSSWVSVHEYQFNYGSGNGFYSGLNYSLSPTNQAEQFRFVYRGIDNGQRLQLQAITGSIIGLM